VLDFTRTKVASNKRRIIVLASWAEISQEQKKTLSSRSKAQDGHGSLSPKCNQFLTGGPQISVRAFVSRFGYRVAGNKKSQWVSSQLRPLWSNCFLCHQLIFNLRFFLYIYGEKSFSETFSSWVSAALHRFVLKVRE